MEYNVTSGIEAIDFGATGVKEILQNIRMILSTVTYSCPMNRDFAWNPDLLDGPINLIKAKMTSRIVAAIHQYEPRAQVTRVTYQGDGSIGVLKPVVGVKINAEV